MPDFDVADQLAAARGTAIGVEQFGVLAIECPAENLFAADFEAFYGSLVFGGGSVTVARNSAEFANLVGAACLPSAPFDLLALEGIQAVQDWQRSVPLVAGKETLVRAHLRATDDAGLAVARLRGSRAGVELPASPLTAINPGGGVLVEPDAARPLATRREALDGSLNFRLPTSWTSGTVELRLDRVATNIDCRSAPDVSDDCAASITFVAGQMPPVKFIRVAWADGDDAYRPSVALIETLAQRVQSMLPIAALDWTSGVVEAPEGPPSLTQINGQLLAARLLDGCRAETGCTRLDYGIVLGADDLGGRAINIPGDVASGYVWRGACVPGGAPCAISADCAEDGVCTTDATVDGDREAHELAHLLGRHHAVAPPAIICLLRKHGWCGERASCDAPDFPHPASVGGKTVAALGPLDRGQASLVYGFNASTKTVVSPFSFVELMSYCSPSRWPSEFTYRGILASSAARLGVRRGAEGPSIAYLVVRGEIDVDLQIARFRPFLATSLTTPPAPPVPGDYTLRLTTNRGALVAEIPFAPLQSEADAPETEAPIGQFLIVVPNSPDIALAEIVHDGQVIASRSRSASAPSVTLLVPNGGEVIQDGEIEVAWEASDPDGDPLAFTVQYSADGGRRWDTMVTDWPSRRYAIDRGSVAGGLSARVRVSASDGFLSVSDESDESFAVAGHPPSVSVRSPGDASVYFGEQLVFLEASARDQEDGTLDGARVTWRSDRDGAIGTGAAFERPASTFSEGVHVLTATATDSAGESAVGTTAIQVFRAPVIPRCGDGLVTIGERCDDGNADDGDGCDSDCTPTSCGNGIRTAGELCDDANVVDGDGCDRNCTPTGCGNGVTTAGEQCDDANRNPGDGCEPDCTSTAPPATQTARASATTVHSPPPLPSATTPAPKGTAPPPSPTRPPPCVGDCDGNREVVVSELIVGINIALGQASVAACPPIDSDGDGAVSVADLIRGIGQLLNGCV